MFQKLFSGHLWVSITIEDSFRVRSNVIEYNWKGMEMSEEDHDQPYLYWSPKLHKLPYKHRFVADSKKRPGVLPHQATK